MSTEHATLRRRTQSANERLKDHNMIMRGALKTIANKLKMDAVAAAAMRAIARSALAAVEKHDDDVL